MRLVTLGLIVLTLSFFGSSVSAQSIITVDCTNDNSAEWNGTTLTIRYDGTSRSYSDLIDVVGLHWRPDCAILLVQGDKWIEAFAMSNLSNPWMLYDITDSNTVFVALDYGYIAETDTAFVAIAVDGQYSYVQIEYWQGYSLPDQETFNWKRFWGISATNIAVDEGGRWLTVTIPPVEGGTILLDVGKMFHQGEAPVGW